MLTEIGWWGGILITWVLIASKITYAEMKKTVSTFQLVNWLVNLIVTIAVIALYFYALSSKPAQYLYFGLVAIAAVSLLLIFFGPDAKEDSDQKGEENKEENKEEEEEVGKGFEIAGAIIFLFPIFIGVALGCYKSYGLLFV